MPAGGPAHPLIIIAAYNEAENLPHVLADLRASGLPADILVIDDGSRDATADLARESGAAVIRHPANRGYAAAVKSGYRYAAERGYPVACLFDADGQHRADQLARILEPLLQDHADVVIGSRYRDGLPYEGSICRRLGTTLFSWLASKLTGLSLTDITSGFRAVNERGLHYFGSHFPGPPPEVASVLLARQAGLRIQEVGVAMRPRLSGASFYTASSSLTWPLRTLVSMARALVRPDPRCTSG